MERQNLGQYFTGPDVVDLILGFCLKHEEDRILDPACGAGTFLVRAYQHKKLLNQMLPHEAILKTLWGVDIAKFPAHLAAINLAINDLGVDNNYPNVLHQDFFSLLVKEEGFDLPERWRRVLARTLGGEPREVVYPRYFDAVVGNPPYSRQEKIQEIGVDKGILIDKALKDLSGKKLAHIGKRAGIYAYFFVHGTKFLKDKGYFGFIVSNSWLDVDYGKGLQELFLNNYKIIAIIESKVERWFEAADINTCIVILQKCKDKKERDANLVRFAYLKQPLRRFIPPAQDMWEKEVERQTAIDKLKKTILAHTDFYENPDMRIFPKTQAELWEEGYDPGEQKYVGARWGKYLRAPEIFFKILEKGKGKLVPLKEVAEVRFGIKTGANEFFYLTEEEIKRRGIEKEFWMHQDEQGNWVPNYVVKNPRECKSIIVKPENLKYRILMIHKDKKELKRTKILKYINEGERKGFYKRPTCSSRYNWYDIGIWDIVDAFWTEFYFSSYRVIINENVLESDKFYGIKFKKKNYKMPYICNLNCTIYILFREILGFLSLGLGVLKMPVYLVGIIPVINFRLFSKNHKRELLLLNNQLKIRDIGSVFEEIGTTNPRDVNFSSIKPDRRALDQIIMRDILGLTDEEQLEVYRAVIELVKSRIDKARSFAGSQKTADGIDIQALSESIVQTIKKEP